jgi:hypothetical protein
LSELVVAGFRGHPYFKLSNPTQINSAFLLPS